MAGSNPPSVIDQEVKKAKHKEADESELAIAKLKNQWIQWQFLRLNNEFGILNCPDGDTLAYIGPPPDIERQDRTSDETYIQNHFSYPHRVHSSKFLGLNSKKFSDLFGSRSIRTKRRFRKEGVLSRVSTKGIKFFVDLRPPTEDEEAVVLLTSLTCTKGILTWHKAQDIYGLSPMLVAGQDDSSSMPLNVHLPTTLPEHEKASDRAKRPKPKMPSNTGKESSDEKKLEVSDAQLAGDKVGLDTDDLDSGSQNTIGLSLDEPEIPIVAPESPSPNSKKTTKKRKAPTSEQPAVPSVILPEYSLLRHWSAIERLVQAIEDRDPKLDSAPKVWTFFAVAKYFNCASQERISRWITEWLLRYPNSNFIQSNPEVALRIGLGTRSEITTKHAFSILVGEKSLMNVLGETCPTILSPLVQSVHGRKLELLDDDERNRIDHAAASLVRRIRQKFDEIVGVEMAWLLRSSQYKKIFSLVPQNQEEADIVKNLAQKVKQFVRGRIIWVLCRTYDGNFSELESDLKRVRAFYPATRDTFRETYNNLTENERIFTRFFWLALNQEILSVGGVNLWTERISTLGLPEAGSNSLCQKMLDRILPSGERSCQIVSVGDVGTLILQFNQIRRSHRASERPKTKPSTPEIVTNRKKTAISPQGDDNHVQLETSSNTADSENSSSLTCNGFGDFKNLYVTSPKREQTRKQGKLSSIDAGTVAATEASAALDSLPIRLCETSLTKPQGQPFHQTENAIQNTHSETPLHQIDSAPLYNAVIDMETTKGNNIPELSQLLPLQEGEIQRQSWAQGFEYDDSELWTQDASSQQPIADQSPKPSFSPQGGNLAQVITSKGYRTIAKKGDQDREITAADYSYGTGDGKPGPVITAADWSFEADDVDWNSPESEQHLRECPVRDPRLSEPRDLIYKDLLYDITNVLHGICGEIINPAHLFHDDNSLPTNLIDTLMCLNDEEWKYLPLWAGGNDDGTGGVFDEVDVPNLEAGGFRGGKRGIGSVGSSSASGSVSESSFDDIGSDAISTVGRASRAATDGTRTVASLSDTENGDECFMRQNELWDEIRNMPADEAPVVSDGNEEMDGADKGKARATDSDNDFDGFDDDNDGMDGIDVDVDDDDVNTIVGAKSTDGDDDHDMAAEDDPDPEIEGYDEDIEIINADDL